MSFWASLRAVWHRRLFRRLFALRVVSQGADTTLQVGMASYVLFSPAAQPDARAIFVMLAITMLPFSVVGPFVSVVLDRFSRRNTAVAVDSTRAGVALLVAGLALSGARGPGVTVAFYAALLLAMSLSRFLLAGLAASLPFVVDDEDYLAANTVAPIVGPLGACLAGVGMAARVVATNVLHLSASVGDACIFALAAVLFVGSVTIALGFSRQALGPRPGAARTTLSDAWRGLGDGVAELRRKAFAGRATIAIGVQRIGFGLIQVATILMFRNRFHDQSTVTGALADIGIWAGLTGVGFVAASPIAGPLLSKVGLRRGIVGILLANALIQLVPGTLFGRWTLWAAAFGLGVAGQALKIAVDTVTQDVVADALKGRVFVIDDIVFNLAMVAAAGIGVVLLPSDGASVPVFAGVAACYVAVAAWFALATAPGRVAA